MTSSAGGADGCKALLCVAGNRQKISVCHPDVEQALWDGGRSGGAAFDVYELHPRAAGPL